MSDPSNHSSKFGRSPRPGIPPSNHHLHHRSELPRAQQVRPPVRIPQLLRGENCMPCSNPSSRRSLDCSSRRLSPIQRNLHYGRRLRMPEPAMVLRLSTAVEGLLRQVRYRKDSFALQIAHEVAAGKVRGFHGIKHPNPRESGHHGSAECRPGLHSVQQPTCWLSCPKPSLGPSLRLPMWWVVNDEVPSDLE
jgi:hypothetical protein